jgi:hypothetical protein
VSTSKLFEMRPFRQFFIEARIIALLSRGFGLVVAFGFCALVNVLPMPDFFAGLLPN